MKKAFWFGIIISCLGFAVTATVYRRLPEMIPVHWGITGEIDKYGGKYTIFLFPALSLFLTILMYYIPKIDPKGENIRRSGIAYPATIIMLSCFMLVMLGVVLAASLGYAVAVEKVVSCAVGILLVLLGYYMPKIKPNYFFGIRIPWTLANETVWTKTHRVGGKVFFFAGLLFIAGVLIPAPYNFILPFVGMLAGLAGICVYSYIQYKKLK